MYWSGIWGGCRPHFVQGGTRSPQYLTKIHAKKNDHSFAGLFNGTQPWMYNFCNFQCIKITLLHCWTYCRLKQSEKHKNSNNICLTPEFQAPPLLLRTTSLDLCDNYKYLPCSSSHSVVYCIIIEQLGWHGSVLVRASDLWSTGSKFDCQPCTAGLVLGCPAQLLYHRWSLSLRFGGTPRPHFWGTKRP